MTLAPIFLNQNYFRHKYLDVCSNSSFTFNWYLGTSWKQQAAEIKWPKNQLQFKQTVERMWRKLRGPVEHSSKNQLQIFFGNIPEENIWEIFAPRKAARIKLLFSSFFLSTTSLLNTPNFRFIRPALHVFCK